MIYIEVVFVDFGDNSKVAVAELRITAEANILWKPGRTSPSALICYFIHKTRWLLLGNATYPIHCKLHFFAKASTDVTPMCPKRNRTLRRAMLSYASRQC